MCIRDRPCGGKGGYSGVCHRAHPEEPEEPAPVPEMEAPAIDETRFQDVSGLYDEPEAKPVRRTRKTGTAAKRTTRKKVSAEPQEELNSPAFDNFEGVDFDS